MTRAKPESKHSNAAWAADNNRFPRLPPLCFGFILAQRAERLELSQPSINLFPIRWISSPGEPLGFLFFRIYLSHSVDSVICIFFFIVYTNGKSVFIDYLNPRDTEITAWITWISLQCISNNLEPHNFFMEISASKKVFRSSAYNLESCKNRGGLPDCFGPTEGSSLAIN